MLTITIITDESLLLAIVPEWEKLDAALTPRTPFSSPHWCVAWWRHFRRHRLFARDSLLVFVLRDTTGTLVAVAPMMTTRRPAGLPLATREVQFIGADSSVTEIRGPSCRPEHVAEVTQTIERHLKADAARWDWVQWRGLRRTDAVATWLSRTVEVGEMPELVGHYLRLPPSWELFRSGLPRNIKESLRKCYNSLSRENHVFAVRVIRSSEDCEPAVRQFLRLHSKRAGKTGTIKHIDVFASPQARSFLADYAVTAARRDELRIFQLVIADVVVATRIGFHLGDELYLYYSGYDVAWSRYSVMTTLLAEIMRWAIANGVRIVNLSTGTDVSKTRWRPEQAIYAGGFQVAPSRRARLAYAMFREARNRRGRWIAARSAKRRPTRGAPIEPS